MGWTNYCWWKKSCQPVEVGRLSHYLQGFSTIPGGCLGFLNQQQYQPQLFTQPLPGPLTVPMLPPMISPCRTWTFCGGSERWLQLASASGTSHAFPVPLAPLVRPQRRAMETVILGAKRRGFRWGESILEHECSLFWRGGVGSTFWKGWVGGV